MSKTWFITGATRGLGYEIAKAALESGDSVVATGRDPESTARSLAQFGNRLLAVHLDVTDSAGIDVAVTTAIERFGQVDVLVNNAGYGQLGLFEELTDEQIRRQFATNVFGVFDVTRAVLPHMRARRSGHVVTISSISGITGSASSTIYGATKFAVAGWSEGLLEELAPLGIKVTVVHPGFFRTDFLDPSSVGHGDVAIADYAQFSGERRQWLDGMNHAQQGDPAKLGLAIVHIAGMSEPPARWGAGSDSIESFHVRADQLLDSAKRFGDLTRSTDLTESV